MNPYRIFDHIFSDEATIAIVVFALVCLTVLVAVILSHFRKRSATPARQVEKNSKVEGTYALVVAAVAIFVIVLSFNATAQEDHLSGKQTQPEGAAKVTVTGYQWCWNFRYPGHDISISGSCHPGHRGALPTMVIPVGKQVTIDVRSRDVIHSWWVPALRYKMDAFPKHTNTFTMTVDHAGTWLGHCAEFCGNRHFSMEFLLKAVPAKQYQQWLASGGAASALAA